MIYNTTDKTNYIFGPTMRGLKLELDLALLYLMIMVNAPNIPAFSVWNIGNAGTSIFGKTSVGSNGEAGVHGDATILGSYGIKGTGFDGIGGYLIQLINMHWSQRKAALDLEP